MHSENSLIMTEFDHTRLDRLLATLRNRGGQNPPILDALDQVLEFAQVVEPSEVPPDVVTMNSRVELLDLDTSESLHFTLVFPGAADLDDGRISVLAPIGLALLGSRAREVLACSITGRHRRLRIESLVYQPEASEHFHL